MQNAPAEQFPPGHFCFFCSFPDSSQKSIRVNVNGMPVVISMFGGWAFCIVVGFGCFFLAKIAPVWAVLCAYILLFLILWLVLHRWLKKKGTKIFASL